ncbi:Piso0_002111 [Millerozyma farinosa CBS 7064]|uniref:Piso0_002111 protein n=1 Tax=Pichia sorbitophila (strain ATCC MYA-4447 / BCRC 22081 / CBS 7064 / NBRC 10061 / NRRL Y-12695) TaxID=559304 RepID=G8YE56_PICSO|nr:Piso0_002111 [Millerozyma farinosa CBS 7064]
MTWTWRSAHRDHHAASDPRRAAQATGAASSGHRGTVAHLNERPVSSSDASRIPSSSAPGARLYEPRHPSPGIQAYVAKPIRPDPSETANPLSPARRRQRALSSTDKFTHRNQWQTLFSLARA